MDYVLQIFVFICIFSVLSLSLDLLVGHTGLLSLAQAAFFGLGAYSSALLSIHLDLPFPLSFVLAAGFAAFASLLVSLPSLRLSEDYFVIATFGLQMILFSIFNNWMAVTNGPLGLAGIPRPILFGWAITSPLGYALFAFSLLVLSSLIVLFITNSPFGRVLHAIREDELFAQSVGKNTVRFKITICAVSAALAALAGSAYAGYVTFIDPTSFTVMESILIISMIIVGGSASIFGPIIGAISLVLLPELLRFVGVPQSIGANLRQVVYGALLVIIITYRPRGLVGRYAFGRHRPQRS